MITSSRGIVLHTTDYSETSLIARIYTRNNGLLSFIAKGVRKKGASIRKNLFQPLNLVEVVYYLKENTSLHTLREISIEKQFHLIPADISRSSVLIYMNELLNRSISAVGPDPGLFDFIRSSVLRLDDNSTVTAAFPLDFTLQLTHYLGFSPRADFDSGHTVFDLMEGCYSASEPDHPYYIKPPLSKTFARLLENLELSAETRYEERSLLLEKLFDYYRLHLPGFGEMKSYAVLKAVLRD